VTDEVILDRCRYRIAGYGRTSGAKREN